MQVLRRATINGGRAVGLDRLIGSLEPGKRADLIGLNLFGSAHPVAVYKVVSQVVYCARTSNVELAMVNGRVLLRNREVLGLDEPGFLHQAQAAGTDLVAWLEERRK